jgi:hypothetical protein
MIVVFKSKGYNDIEERDVIEAYHEVAIKKN